MKVILQQLNTGLSIPLYSCSVQPNGNRIACGSNDGRIRIWKNVGTIPSPRLHVTAENFVHIRLFAESLFNSIWTLDIHP